MNIIQSPSPLTADNGAPRFYDLREVAQILKCSVRTVRRLLADGRLGYSQERKGGVIRVSAQDIADYYEASRIGPAVSHRSRSRRRQPARAAA
ncbi:helix-turn-helix domain-containing protein [Streptomyces sp. NRRL S-813]|uniref:helix-turn-helix domain-containing protein n=1 Tax=Streptomyces sp. NRRL S-813 TaxID=1463919 RepID=UPI0004BECEE9|nr:helix-turn-helix domain-containing protein [Streptomyces sp. NRRL S-813]